LVGLATVEIPTAILASAGTPTTAIEVPKTEWTPTTHDFLEKLLKYTSERPKIREKGH
jgi:hypothetical protein